MSTPSCGRRQEEALARFGNGDVHRARLEQHAVEAFHEHRQRFRFDRRLHDDHRLDAGADEDARQVHQHPPVRRFAVHRQRQENQIRG